MNIKIDILEKQQLKMIKFMKQILKNVDNKLLIEINSVPANTVKIISWKWINQDKLSVRIQPNSDGLYSGKLLTVNSIPAGELCKNEDIIIEMLRYPGTLNCSIEGNIHFSLVISDIKI